MLGRNGVECTTCQNAKEAILALDRLDYDLVLTDIQMPVTDGFGLLRLLRNSDIGNSRTVPVAVMTARGDGDSGVYMKSGFAVAYISLSLQKDCWPLSPPLRRAEVQACLRSTILA